MPHKSKTIRDPIHGDIKLEGLFLELIEAPEIQRLYNIKQLGFAHLVYPGAHHTRLEHSLGTYHMASKAAEILNFNKDEKEIIACAAFLHDIGHGPFSHTLESLIRESLNVDHVDLTEKLIFGEHTIFEPYEIEYVGSSCVFDILDKNSIDKREIVSIIRGKTHKKPYLSQILNSSIDVDQLDYLIRDSYYTGVAYGMIDIERFLQTLIIEKNRLNYNRAYMLKRKPLVYSLILLIFFSLPAIAGLRIGSFNVNHMGGSRYTNYDGIAKIINGEQYSIVALQEVSSEKGLIDLIESLGGGWKYIVTDEPCNGECFAFLWDTNKKIDLDTYSIWQKDTPLDNDNIKRPPFVAGFRQGTKMFWLLRGAAERRTPQ